MIKRALILSMVAAAAAGQAQAADLPIRAAPVLPLLPVGYNWTGFYIGGSVGYVTDQERKHNLNDGTFVSGSGGNGANANNFTLMQSTLTSNSRIQSVVGGPQVGYNYQIGSFVFGLEGDANVGDFKKSASSSGLQIITQIVPNNPARSGSLTGVSSFEARYNIDAFGTLRGRVGYAFDNVLFYVTGGAVIADVALSGSTRSSLSATGAFVGQVPTFSTNSNLRSSKIEIAPTVGGGIEFALTRNWSIKGEYLYLMLPNQNVALNGGSLEGLGVAIDTTRRFHGDMHLGRIGVNYRF